MYPRTNIPPFEEKSNANPVTRVEDALRELARHEGTRHEPENARALDEKVESIVGFT